jgi:predicted O-methyltransferase YrrM
MSVLKDSGLEGLLTRLHDRSEEQEKNRNAPERNRDSGRTHAGDAASVRTFMSDKMVALDRDKAEFCYQLCRANKSRRIVEIGTSYGVSTLYLAAAVRENWGKDGLVIGTEYEPGKAEAARAHFAEAGFADVIELREGDLRETLRHIDGPVDFALVDIWIDMARPALELVAPHLRSGAIVVCDNTEKYRGEYADYFAFINDPANGFRTMTLPFKGGLEFSVRA